MSKEVKIQIYMYLLLSAGTLRLFRNTIQLQQN